MSCHWRRALQKSMQNRAQVEIKIDTWNFVGVMFLSVRNPYTVKKKERSNTRRRIPTRRWAEGPANG
jgi:hypothetical protein